jgi:dihydrolipoamide dehydrogenase
MLRRFQVRLSNGGFDFDAVVIGGGPGGYVAAIRLAQLGLKTACVEKDPVLGGTCLNVGCIPSKALLHSSWKYYETLHHMDKYGISASNVSLDFPKMMAYKNRVVQGLNRGIDSLFRKNHVERITGHASFVDSHTISVSSGNSVRAKHFVIATGSVPVKLPFYDGVSVVTSDEAVSFPEVPESLVVCGGGIIGVELGSVWARLGSKVTVIENKPRICAGADQEGADLLLKELKKQGVQFHFGARLADVKLSKEGNEAILTDGAKLNFEKLLLAIGRRPNTGNLGLDKLGITPLANGAVPVDVKTLQTLQHKHIYAIGDAAPGPMLAHKAEDEGIHVAETIANGGTATRKSEGEDGFLSVPSVVYTHPELAWVGDVRGGDDVKVSKFPFMGNSRARAVGDSDGHVKLFTKEGIIIGASVVNSQAGELLNALSIAIHNKLSGEELAHISVAHPTLSEAIKEVAMADSFKAVHF